MVRGIDPLGRLDEANGRLVLLLVLRQSLVDESGHRCLDVLEQTLTFGVTTVLDMGTPVEFAAQMRSEQVSASADDRA